ncbi:hypothetical protein AcW1_001468 [Taiwanofungus camphoratus]|nr:hypothetical protein AcW1_001468 [Antrodia cinnamomea]
MSSTGVTSAAAAPQFACDFPGCNTTFDKRVSLAAHKNSLHSVTFNVTYLEEKITLTRDSESDLFTCPCEQFQTKDTKRLGEHIKRAHSSLVKRSGARVTSERHAPYPVNRSVTSKETVGLSFSAGHSLGSESSSVQNLVSGSGSDSGSGSGSAMNVVSDVVMNMDEDVPMQIAYNVASDLTAHLDGATCYLITNDFLKSINCQIHSHYKIIICMACETAYTPASLAGHLVNQHDFKKTDLQTQINLLAEEYGIHGDTEIAAPLSDGPPVEGIKMKDGFKCNLCTYCCGEYSMIRKHYNISHKHLQLQQDSDKWRSSSVQTFFNMTARHYFAVNPSLIKISSTSHYGHFLTQILPHQSVKVYTAPSTQPKDMNPLMCMTQWLVHLEPYIGTKQDVKKLVQLAELPGRDDEVLGSLSGHIFKYLDQGRGYAHQAPYTVRRMLWHYPIDTKDASAWTVHERNDTLTHYATDLTRFMAAILRSIQGQSEYQFPLTEEICNMGLMLWDQLESGELNVGPLLHNLIYLLIGEPAPGSDLDTWQCPLMCWLAISSIRSDGRFISAYEYTPVLAHWEYLMRHTHLCQAYKRQEEIDISLLEATEYQASHFLLEGLMTPWNSIREHQHYASTLVMREAAPPHITWTKDMSSLSCEGHVLEMAQLRSGLNRIYDSIMDHIHHLTCNTDIPINVPDNLTEDMTDRSIGLSWIQKPNLTEKKYPLLEILFQHPDYKIAYVDRAERFHWNVLELIRLQREFAEINKELAILTHMLPAPPPRGTEFADTRLSNGQIMRNIFKDFGSWIIHHRIKTSETMESLSWVPTLCPVKLGKLLDWYCLVIRSVEAMFAEVIDGPTSKALYEEFLYVHNGRQMDSRSFSVLLECYSQTHMNSRFGLHVWRHMAVAIQREFITPNSNGPTADSQKDRLMNHSTRMARHTYSGEEGDLPFLTTDAMIDSRQICEDWHDVLGWGSNAPPLPMRLRNYRLGQVAGSDNQSPQTAASTSGMDMTQLSNLISAAVSAGMNQVKVDMENQIKTAVAQGIAAYMSQQSKGQLTSTVSPHPSVQSTHPPVQLTVQPTRSSVQSISSAIGASDECVEIAPPASPAHTHTSLDYLDEEPASAAEPLTGFAHLSAATEAEMLPVLQQAFRDPEMRFKSPEQMELLKRSMARDCNVLTILPTGGGKSIAFEVPAMLEEKLTVVFVPYVALIADMMRRAAEKGTKSLKWHSGCIVTFDVRLLFVSYESLGTKAFKKFMGNNLTFTHRLVVDETHSILVGSTYRQGFNLMKNLQEWPIAKIYLTGTMPPQLVNSFCEFAGLDLKSLLVIRAQTNRPELRYHVIRLVSQAQIPYMTAHLCTQLQRQYFESKSRGILFCLTIKETEFLAEMLGCLKYNSQMSDGEKAETQSRWMRGTCPGELG